MMIHDGFSQATGNAQEMRELADLLDRQSDNIAGVYSDRTGKPADYWRAQMQKETWYTGDQAVAAGLADHVLNVEAAQATWSGNVKFRNAPESVKLVAAAAKQPASSGSDSDDGSDGSNGWVMDDDGTCRFDPDGDGDDDATPEGDTDHDYFDADGNQVKAIPPKPKGMKKASKAAKAASKSSVVMVSTTDTSLFRDATSVDNSAWDASKAMAAGAKADNPAAFYKGICAGRRAGDPANQSSWALPYKYSPSSAPNASAVRNALARIGQTQGLTNKAEAQSLLEGLMKEVNPDYDATSDSIDVGILQSLLTTALEGSAR